MGVLLTKHVPLFLSDSWRPYSASLILFELYRYFKNDNTQWSIIDILPDESYWIWYSNIRTEASNLNIFPYFVIRSSTPWPGTADYMDIFICGGTGIDENITNYKSIPIYHPTDGSLDSFLIGCAPKGEWDTVSHSWASGTSWYGRQVGWVDKNEYYYYSSSAPKTPGCLYIAADDLTFIFVTYSTEPDFSSNNQLGPVGCYVGAFNSIMDADDDPYPCVTFYSTPSIENHPTSEAVLTWGRSAFFYYANRYSHNAGYTPLDPLRWGWQYGLHITNTFADAYASGDPKNRAQSGTHFIEHPAAIWGPISTDDVLTNKPVVYWGTMKYVKITGRVNQSSSVQSNVGMLGLGREDVNQARNRVNIAGLSYPVSWETGR